MPSRGPRADGAARRALAVGVLVLTLVGWTTIGAGAVSPSSGPTAGQTSVAGDVPAALTFTQVAAGGYHSVGLGADGLVYAWGQNSSGQLGNGTTTDSSTPVAVSLPDGITVTAVAAGVRFSVALSSDGQVYTWGQNAYGQLGNGTTTDSSVPVAVPLPDGVTITAVAAGYFHALALASDGTVHVWGYNSLGQLGDGTTTDSSLPVVAQLPDGVAFTSLYAAGYHSVALGSDGAVYSWGDNRDSELGDGTATSSSLPVAAQLPTGVTATEVSTNYGTTVAVGSDGNVYAWGSGGYGQLGNGTTGSSPIPTTVQVPAGVTLSGLAGGEYHTVATGSDGSTYAWGWNTSGQLGIGTTANALVPTVVQEPAGITLSSFTAGVAHTSAIGSDGNLYSWGQNTYGQLGDGTTTGSSVPVLAVTDDVQVLAVEFGGVAGTDLTQADGTWTVLTPAHLCGTVDVQVTASHSFGQVGTRTATDGTFTYGSAPTVTQQPDPAVQVPATGGDATVTATADGDESPTVQWQQSLDGTWTDITGATSPSLTLAVTATTELRAVFTNCLGSATTTTVTLAPPDPTPTPTPTPTPDPDIAPDGGGTADGGSDGTSPDALAVTGAIGVGILVCSALALLSVGALLRRIDRPRRG